MITNIEITKPEPVAPGEKIETFKSGTGVSLTIEALEAGNPILVTDL